MKPGAELMRSCLVAAGFTAVVVLIDPRGDFPLNDDWNFALAAWNFSETGVVRLARFTGMSLRLQVLWGAGWTRLFGESFEVLRASTLILSLVCLIVFDRFAGKVGIRGPARWIVTGSLLFHPIFLWSSFTFMTQIPFLTLAILAVVFFHRGLSAHRSTWIAAGIAATIAAAFIRQTAIALLVAPAVVLLSMRASLDRRWLRWVGLLAAAFTALAAVYLFTPYLHGHPAEREIHTGMWAGSAAAATTRLLWNVVHHAVLNLEFAAVFMLPLAILVVPRTMPSRTWILAAMVAGMVFLAVTAWWVGSGDAFPFRAKGQVLNNLALGPLTLRDTFVMGYRYPRHLPYPAQAAMSYLAAVLAAMLFGHLADQWRRRENETPEHRATVRLLIASAAAATLVLAVSPVYFDRYSLDSLWGLPILIGITAPLQPRWRSSATLLAALAIGSMLGVSEYLDWNRARWDAFARLRTAGVPLSRMDGGYEINQYLVGGFEGPKQLSKPGWSVVDDEYVLSFHELPGYRTVGRYPYSDFLGLSDGAVLIQHRLPVRSGESVEAPR